MMSDLKPRLPKLGFRASDDALDAFLTRAGRTKATVPHILAELCPLEVRKCDTIHLQRSMRMATMGTFKDLESLIGSTPRFISRNLYDQLCTTEFIREHENVLLRGQVGVGKTTLPKNLGHLTLATGYQVRFTTLADLVVDLLRQDSIPAFQRRLRSCTRPHLLIIDALGRLPADAKAADALCHVLAERHEKRSTPMTTNLAFKEWTTIFPNAANVTALVERRAPRCHVMDIDADSWRAKDASDFKKRVTLKKPVG